MYADDDDDDDDDEDDDDDDDDYEDDVQHYSRPIRRWMNPTFMYSLFAKWSSVLTLSQATNFRLFRTVKDCRLQFQILWIW